MGVTRELERERTRDDRTKKLEYITAVFEMLDTTRRFLIN